MYRIVLIFISFFIFISCNSNSEKAKSIGTNVKKIIINLDLVKEITPNDLFSNIKVTPLQTNQNTLIGKAEKAIFYKNEVYILDQMQSTIFIFKLNGLFSRKINKKGKGPGEYTWIEDFAINQYNDNIEIIDGRNLFTYDNECNFIKKIRITNNNIPIVNELEIINNDILAFLRTKSPQNVLYSRSRNSFIYKNDIFPVWATKKLPYFFGRITKNNLDTIIYHEAFSGNIFLVDKNGYHLKYQFDFLKYNFDFTKSSIMNELKSTKRKLNTEISNIILDKYAYLFQHYIENSKYIFIAFRFKRAPTYILYNKRSGKYLIYSNRDLGKLLIGNKPSVISFIGENEILALSDNRFLKRLSDDCMKSLSDKDRNAINKLSLSDNPVLIKLQFNPIVIKDIKK